MRPTAAALDPAETDALYRTLAPIFQADLPVTYLYREHALWLDDSRDPR